MRAGTVTISVVLHGIAIALLAPWSFDARESASAVTSDPVRPRVELVPIVPFVPIDVTIVEPQAPAAAVGSSGVRSATRETSPHRELAAATTNPVETSLGPKGEIDTAPNPLAMRGRRHDLTLSPETAERIAGAGGGNGLEKPEDDPRWAHDPKIKLRPSGGGRHQILDVTATIDVAPDGTVDMKKKPHFSAKLNLPTAANLRAQRDAIKEQLSAWAADPYAGTRVGSRQDLPAHLQAVQGACERWNDPMCFTAQDQAKVWAAQDRAITSKVGSLLEVNADITGYLMDKHAGDPYASRKQKILDQTRDERVRIGTAYRADQLARSPELVRRNLVALWRTTTDPAQRRTALFEIWDECGEGTDAAGVAGDRARIMVIGWIRKHLPQGARGAYTASELDTLNARRTSRQRFVPYE
ncbi:MAG TPA: hypothetical protein VIU61_03185 [Kofleriaceae bacterium]